MFKLRGEGGGGVPRKPYDAANTLQSNAIFHVLEILSEGQVVGLENGDKDIFINGIPLEDDEGNRSFQDVVVDGRIGVPLQEPITGFNSVSSIYNSGVAVTTSSPAVHETTGDNTNYISVGFLFQQGLWTYNKGTGDRTGNSVDIEIYLTQLTPSVGTEYLAASFTISGKQTTPYETDRKFVAPANADSWRIRVVRVTPDDDTDPALTITTSSMFSISRWVDIFTPDVALSYPNVALIGISIPAESVGNQIPTRGYLVKGIICQVPNGTIPWDGGFVSAWTDNTAWVLYDLITNERYGIGKYIGSSLTINKFEFYDAAVYNDGLVQNGVGGTEKRNTFNGIIQTQMEAWDLLQTIASTMQAVVVVENNNRISLVQDRPTDVSKILTNASVIDGVFTYTSSDISQRINTVNVTFNDPEDKYLPRTVTEPKSDDVVLLADIDKYGYNPSDIVAFGCTSEGQARRLARWSLYSSIYEPDSVVFSLGTNVVGLKVGDVVSIIDNDYITDNNTTFLGGRIVSVDPTRTIITLDREIDLSGSGATFTTTADDYVTIIETEIATTTTASVITLTSPLPVGTYEQREFYSYKLGTIEPRKFRIVNISEEDGQYTLTCNFYDPQKWSVVEDYMSYEPVTYSVLKPLGAVTGLAVIEDFRNDDNIATNLMRVVWDYNPKHLSYNIWIQREDSEKVLHQTANRFLEFENIPVGSYRIDIVAIGLTNQTSPTATLLYSYGNAPALVLPPINLQVIGGGSVFNDTNVGLSWEFDPTNLNAAAGHLKDYVVSIYDQTGTTKVTEYIIPYITDKTDTLYKGATATYGKEFILSDFGALPRTFQVKVQSRDLLDRLGAAASITLTNPAPAVPVMTLSGFGNEILAVLDPINIVPDSSNLIMAASFTSGFSHLDKTTWFSKTLATTSVIGTTISAIADGTYYIRAALDDTYSDEGLNWTVEYTVVIAAGSATLVFPTPNKLLGVAVTQETLVNESGEVYVESTITWTPIAGDRVSSYTLAYKNVTVDPLAEFSYADTTETRVKVPISMANQDLVVKVRANFGDSFSPWSDDLAFNSGQDTAAPAATSFTANGGIGFISLTIVKPVERDYSHTEIWFSFTNDRAAASNVGQTSDTIKTFSGFTTQIDGFVWIRHVDTTGNIGAYFPSSSTAGVPVATEKVAASDMTPDIEAGLTSGVPSNLPVPTGINVANNGNGSRDITLIWDAYIQGAVPASNLVLFAYEVLESDVVVSDTSLLLSFDGTEGSTVITDSSDHNHSITNVGGATITSANAIFDQNVHFDQSGTPQRVNIYPTNDSLFMPSGTEFTIDFWFRVDVYGTNQFNYLIGFSNGYFIINPTVNKIRFVAGTNTTIGYINPGTYHHIRVCRDADNILYTFMDGAIKSSALNTYDFGSPAGGFVTLCGFNPTDLGGSVYGFSGYIDDLTILKGICLSTDSFPVPVSPHVNNETVITIYRDVTYSDVSTISTVDSTSYTYTGVPADKPYRVGIAASRSPNGVTEYTPIVQPVINPGWVIPAGVMDITANIDGVSAADISQNIVDFDNQNNRNESPIVDPVILAGDLTHTIESNGSPKIQLVWSWSGVEAEIDGFGISAISRASSAPYTFGTTPAEEIIFQVPADARGLSDTRLDVTKYYTIAITAFRKTDPDVGGGLVLSNTVYAPDSPYLPETNVTIDGTTDVNDVAASSNKLLAGAPTNSPVPLGVTITTSSFGGRNVDITWSPYVQGAVKADYLVIIAKKTGAGVPLTMSDTIVNVGLTSTSYSWTGLDPIDEYRVGMAAARNTVNGVEYTPIVQPLSSPDWFIT